MVTRKIKFRAWSLKDNKYLKCGISEYGHDTKINWEINGGLGFIVNPKSNQFILEQFTGLHDKNGVEIYEGDIYRHGDSILKVVWYEYGFAAYEEGKDEYTCLNKHHQKYYEVIGNIHEEVNQ